MFEFIYCLSIYCGVGCVVAVARGTLAGERMELNYHNRRYLLLVQLLWPLYLVLWALFALWLAVVFVVGFARGFARGVCLPSKEG